MPFTGSHPAAVLPLTRLGLSTPALVIGSMAPDLPYFLPFLPDRDLTHSFVGIVLVNPLLGLVCLALWHTLIAPLALAVSPAPVRRRVPAGAPPRPRRPRAGDLSAGLLGFAALALGSATHVLWDLFTHYDDFGARQLPWLAAQHGILPGYRWAQYASGVVGALLIALALWRWWRRTAPTADPASALPSWASATVWTAVLVGTAAGAVAGALAAAAAPPDNAVLRRTVFLVTTWGGGTGLVIAGLAALACARHLSAARRTPAAAPPEKVAT